MPTHTQRLLERLRKIADPPTDYQLAKMLGVERQHVHNWRKKGQGMDLVTAYTLADLLHEDRAIIAGMVELDKANLSKEKKERLEHMLPRLVASTSVAFLAYFAAAITTSGRAHADTVIEGQQDVSSHSVADMKIPLFTSLLIMRPQDHPNRAAARPGGLSAKAVEVLRILQREPHGARGLDIVARSNGVLGRASIYVVLGDLEEQGCVRADRRGDSGRLPRPRYFISARGLCALTEFELRMASVAPT